MLDSLLVRSATGSWEELKLQESIPDGGFTEVFGTDLRPIVQSSNSVVVVAAAPALSTGSPDAICLDSDGGIWVVSADLTGGGEGSVPQLVSFGGELTGMDWQRFSELCDLRGSKSLEAYVVKAVSESIEASALKKAAEANLAAGRIKLAALVKSASPMLRGSLKFLNASGANASAYEVVTYASESVTAMRSNPVELDEVINVASIAAVPEPAKKPAAKQSSPAVKRVVKQAESDELDIAQFAEMIREEASDNTGDLFEQLAFACQQTFGPVEFDTRGAKPVMYSAVGGDERFITAHTDGAIDVSFLALGKFDAKWSIRAELCQGMERLLGADLGDVREIGQLNIHIDEHLMDATLMEVMIELLAETAESLRDQDSTIAA